MLCRQWHELEGWSSPHPTKCTSVALSTPPTPEPTQQISQPWQRRQLRPLGHWYSHCRKRSRMRAPEQGCEWGSAASLLNGGGSPPKHDAPRHPRSLRPWPKYWNARLQTHAPEPPPPHRGRIVSPSRSDNHQPSPKSCTTASGYTCSPPTTRHNSMSPFATCGWWARALSDTPATLAASGDCIHPTTSNRPRRRHGQRKTSRR